MTYPGAVSLGTAVYTYSTNVTSGSGSTYIPYIRYVTSSSTASGTYLTASRGGWTDLGYADEHGFIERYNVDAPAVELTAEQRAEQERLQRERQAEAETQRRNRADAEARATELLMSMLPENQKEPYRLTGYFEIIGSRGTRYRINRGVAGNIQWLDGDGKIGGSLCCHPPTWGDNWVPTPDIMLAQMLALQTDEADFIRVANVMSGRRPVLV